MAEKINVEIKTDYDGADAKQAISDAEKLEGLKPEIEITADTSAFDDVKSKGTEAAEAIRQAAIDMDTELRNTALAVDALSTALGTTADKMDVPQVVADLQKIGLTADDVRQDAGQLATALKFADDLDTGRVNSALDSTGGKLDTMRGSADQSRSVLANMAGNAAQDLGAVGGVAGTAGVAIGQLAEYATEGNINLGNLVKVAGPMLGLAAAVGMVTAEANRQQKQAEETAKAIDTYTKAIDDLGPSAEAAARGLEELTNQAVIPDKAGLFENIIGSVKNLGEEFTSFFEIKPDVVDPVAILGDIGYSADEVAAAMDGGQESFDAFMNKIDNDPRLEGFGRQVETFLTDNFDNYTAAVDRAEGRADFFAQRHTAGGINEALSAQQVQLTNTTKQWDAVIRDLDDGNISANDAVYSWNRLQTELGLTDDEMTALANQKLAEKLEADAAAADEAAQKILAMRDAIDEAKQAGVEYQAIVGGEDWGKASVEAAETAMTGYFDQFFEHGDQVGAVEEAYDGLEGALTAADEAGISWFDTLFSMNSSEGRQARSALRELGDSLIPEIEDAYTDADGDQQKFSDNMHDLATRVLTRLTTEFGLSTDEANALLQQLGLVPENVETMYDLIGDEEAVVKLGLLQGVIDALPTDVQTEVAMHILQDDPQAALDAIERAVAGGVTTPLYLNTQPAMDAFWALQGAIRLAGIAASIHVSTATVNGAAVSTSAASSSAPNVTNVTLNLPRGTRPDDTVRSLDRWTRRNGRSHAARR